MDVLSSAVSALIAGEVNVMFSSLGGLIPHVKAGRLRTLGVTGAKRAAQAPEIPTFEESGVSGVEAYDFYGILAPAGTPRPVIAKLNAKIIEVLNVPDIANRFAVTQFAEVVGSTPEELTKFMRVESERWKKVIKTAGIKVE